MKNAKRSLPDVTVTWMADARRDLGDNLCHQLGMELLVAFALHPMNGTSLVAQKDASSSSGDLSHRTIAIEKHNTNKKPRLIVSE